MYIIALLFSCLGNMLFDYLSLQLFLLLSMHIVLPARAFSPLHTHSPWSRSDDPGFARPDIGRLFLMCRCLMRRYALRGAWVLFLWFWYFCIFLFLLLFLDSRISHLACHSIPVISWFYLYRFQLPFSCHCSSAIIVIFMYMCYCSDHWLSCFRFIACSGYFRLSVYTWGIFLAYMRRHNVSVSLGSGRYSLVSEPRFDIKWEPSSYL